MSEYLTDTDLASAGQDLTSWILQEDHPDQDFCYEAKEKPSHHAGFKPGATSPFNILPGEDMEIDVNTEESLYDLRDFLSYPIKCEPSKDCFEDIPVALIDDDMDIKDIMRMEIMKQQEIEQQQFLREQEREEALQQELQLQEQLRLQEQQLKEQLRLKELEKQEQLRAQEIERQEQMKLQEILQQQMTEQFSSPQIEYIVSDAPSVEMEGAFHAHSSVVQDNSANLDADAIYHSSQEDLHQSPSFVIDDITPTIISVPVSEALHSPSVEYGTDVTVIPEQDVVQSEPLIISLQSENIPSPSSSTSSEEDWTTQSTTLREILNTESADDFIKDMISAPSSSSHDTDTSDTEWSDSSEKPVKAKCSRVYSVAERKLRKKEQNKRAAIRYRQKKKEEEEQTLSAYNHEKELNSQLLKRRREVKQELEILKKLARDLIRSRQRNN